MVIKVPLYAEDQVTEIGKKKRIFEKFYKHVLLKDFFRVAFTRFLLKVWKG